MHERLFAAGAAPHPTVIMGLLMQPYSLGHFVRLVRLNNPLADSDTASPDQLEVAALVCHQGWRECERMPWDCLIRLKLWLWNRRKRGLDHLLELAKFIAYRDQGCLEFPPSGIQRPTASDPQIAGAPYVLRLQQWLVMEWGLSEEQSWDYPLGLAKMRWQCACEEAGSFGIYNEAEASLDRYRDEQEAKEGVVAK